MKRNQTMWFIEVVDIGRNEKSRLIPWSGATHRRAALQNHLDETCKLAKSTDDRIALYDRWNERRRAGLIRAVKVTVSWEARR